MMGLFPFRYDSREPTVSLVSTEVEQVCADVVRLEVGVYHPIREPLVPVVEGDQVDYQPQDSNPDERPEHLQEADFRALVAHLWRLRVDSPVLIHPH